MTKSGSLIIVTARWPGIAAMRDGWIAGKRVFGKVVTGRRAGT
jgi:hypothetical protein